MGGTYLGDGVPCDGNPCDPNNGNTCDTAAIAEEGPNAFDTTYATDSQFGPPDEDQCPGTFLDWDQSADFWFKWEAPGDGLASFTTCDPTSYDTSMVLYAGSSCGDLTQIACNGDGPDDGSCQEYYSLIEGIDVATSETIWVRLGGWQAAQGTGTLTITFDGTTAETGGCCVGTSCAVLTEVACAASSGTYLGNGTSCFNHPCDDPVIGACCTDGSCNVVTESECIAGGGIYVGDETDCGGSPCGGSTGSVTLRSLVIGTDLVQGTTPSWTVDIYAEIPEGWRIDAVAGNSLQQKTVATTTSFYQDPYGGPTSQDINPSLYPLVPDLPWDSRVTIGCLDQSGDPFGDNELNSIGIDWSTFESGGDLSVGDGTWFCLPIDQQGSSQPFLAGDCSIRNGVLIARLTSLDHTSQVLFEALFQGRDDQDVTWQDTASLWVELEGELDCNANRVPDACDIAQGTSEDEDGDGIPDECESPCQWDLNGDGTTDVNDLLTVIGGFGATYDVNDLLALLADFGCDG